MMIIKNKQKKLKEKETVKIMEANLIKKWENNYQMLQKQATDNFAKQREGINQIKLMQKEMELKHREYGAELRKFMMQQKSRHDREITEMKALKSKQVEKIGD